MLTNSTLLLAFVLVSAMPMAAQDLSQFDAGGENRVGLTFTPDGRQAFWSEWDGAWGKPRSLAVIYTSELRDGAWSEPEPAPFSGQYPDDDPFVSPDGRWLYFVSERPADDTDKDLDADIWRYNLIEDGRPERLAVNSDAAEYSPVVTLSGALYFASARAGGPGQGDIYRATPLDGGFAPAEPIGSAINSSTGEWNVWVADDESELIFEASSRSTNVSVSGDLYYSWRTPIGWAPAIPITRLNTAGSELMPRMDSSRTTLYYTTAQMGGHASIETANWQDLRSGLRADYAPLLLVANRSSHEVSFVDLSRGEVVASVPTGEGPHLLSNVSAGRVLAPGYGEFPQPHTEPVAERPPFVRSLSSRLTLIDTTNRTLLRDWRIEECTKPHASWIVDDSAYVTCEEEMLVIEVNLANGEVTRTFDTRQQGSHVLGFEPVSRTLTVSNTDSGSVTLINIDSGETAIVKLGSGSEGSLVAGDQAWIGNAWDGSVSVLDLPTQEVASIEPVCNFPIAFGDRGRHIWVACFGSAELVAIDTETFTAVRRIELAAQPLNLVVHPDLELAYVSYPRMNAIAEIDLVSGNELRRIKVGIEPDGLRWADR